MSEVYTPHRRGRGGEPGEEQHNDCRQCSNIDACGFCEGEHLPMCKFYDGPPPAPPSRASEIFGAILTALRII